MVWNWKGTGGGLRKHLILVIWLVEFRKPEEFLMTLKVGLQSIASY